MLSDVIHVVSTLFLLVHETVPGMDGFAVLWVQPFPVWTFVIEIALTLLLIAAVFLFKPRILKIMSVCGAEFCLWQALKAALGTDSLLVQIFTWITAAVAVILTLAIVNMIPWKPYGSGKADGGTEDKTQRQ